MAHLRYRRQSFASISDCGSKKTHLSNLRFNLGSRAQSSAWSSASAFAKFSAGVTAV